MIGVSVSAQVGIGNTPKPKSILDLSNSNDKYLVMPETAGDPFFLLTDTAAVIYYKGNLYMKTDNGIKVFTPWKWDGDSTHFISSPTQATVTIGMYPDTPVPYKLQVADAGEITTAGASPASIVIGEVNSNPICPHVLIGSDEIMAKSNATTAGTLKFQEESGVVEIRSTATDAGTSNVLKAYGGIEANNVNATGKIQEGGNDLLPQGSIIMWSGAVVPNGWTLCDGVNHGSLIVPDLRDKFIVGSGNGYDNGDTGGEDVNNHNHTINFNPFLTSATEGNHGHSGTTGGPSGTMTRCWCIDGHVGDGSHTHGFSVSGQGDHQHTISVPVATTLAPSDNENRPPYFALAFIMKL